MDPSSWPFTAIAAVFTGLGVFLANIVKVLEFLGIRPNVKLTCKAQVMPYFRDPVVHDNYEKWINQGPINNGSTDRPGTYWAGNGRRSDLSLFYYWIIEIRNDGRKLLKNVKLTIPNVQAVRFTREHDEKSISLTEPLELGDMSPLATKTVYAWCGILGPSVEHLSLVHDHGHGTVRVHRLAHPVTCWLAKNSSGLLWIVGAIVIVVVSFTISKLGSC